MYLSFTAIASLRGPQLTAPMPENNEATNNQLTLAAERLLQRALGREPRDFSDYVRDAAASGVWNV